MDKRFIQKVDWFALRVIAIGCLLIITASLYHTSFNGYLKLSKESWDCIWAVSQEGLLIYSFSLVIILSYGKIKTFFKYVLIPYCILKVIYHLSCYAGIYLISIETWEDIFSYLCPVICLIGIILIVLKGKDNG